MESENQRPRRCSSLDSESLGQQGAVVAADEANPVFCSVVGRTESTDGRFTSRAFADPKGRSSMRSRSLIACSIVGSLASVALPSWGAEWHSVRAASGRSGPPHVVAQSAVVRGMNQLGLQGVDLALDRVLTLPGLNTVRYRQTHHGLPVYGSTVAVRLGVSGEPNTVMVNVARGLSVSPQPALDQAAALARVAAMGRHAPGPDTTTELGVVPDDSAGGLLVWRVDVPTARGLIRYTVNAHTGDVLKALNLAVDATPKGEVFDINNVRTATPATHDLLNLTVAATPQDQRLVGRVGTVFRFVSGDAQSRPQQVTTEQTALPDSNGDFLYAPKGITDPTDQFAEVNTYYHIDRMDTYYRTKLGVRMGYGLMAVANYEPGGKTFDNAFFTPWRGSFPNAIFLGQGSRVDYSWDSDVILHEFTHYTTHNEIGFSQGPIDFDSYGIVVMPGGMDEGSADYFSCSVNNDTMLGEAALGQYARNLDAPSGSCPSALTAETHADGKLLGTTGWAIRKMLAADLPDNGAGVDLADQIVWGALSLLPTDGSAVLDDFAQGVLTTAGGLKTAGKITDAEVKKIQAVLNDRGLIGCKRILDLVAGDSIRSFLIGLNAAGQIYFNSSCAEMSGQYALSSIFQFRYTPGLQDKLVRFHVGLTVADNGTLDWGIYARKGMPVAFTSTGGSIGLPTTADNKLEHLTGNAGDLVIDDKSSTPFDPQSTYVVVIGNESCASAWATISATTSVPIARDAGVEAGAKDAGRDGNAADVAAGSTDAPNVAEASVAGNANLVGDEIAGGACACTTAGSGRHGSGGVASLLVSLLVMGGCRLRRRWQ